MYLKHIKKAKIGNMIMEKYVYIVYFKYSNYQR